MEEADRNENAPCRPPTGDREKADHPGVHRGGFSEAGGTGPVEGLDRSPARPAGTPPKSHAEALQRTPRRDALKPA